jgi:hypothetical protein
MRMSPENQGRFSTESRVADLKTKHYVRFLNRMAHLDADIELADLVRIGVSAGKLHTPRDACLFDGINPRQHPRLAARVANATNRCIAIQHLRATLCASFIKDIHEDVTAYMQALLQSAARNGLDPGRLIGEHKVTFDGNDILSAGGWNAVIQMVASSVFRRLENEKGTANLLDKINTKLNLGVAQATIDAALPFFEIRHLLVHADGLATDSFCRSFPSFQAKPGKKIKLDHALLQSARSAIAGLVAEFDQKAVDNNIVARSEMQP